MPSRSFAELAYHHNRRRVRRAETCQIWPSIAEDLAQMAGVQETRFVGQRRQAVVGVEQAPADVLQAKLLPVFAHRLPEACAKQAVELSATKRRRTATAARFAFRVRPRLERAGTLFNPSCGGLFILIGAVLPLTH